MTQDVTIRSYQTTDQPQVVALWAVTFPDEPPWNESSALIQTKLSQQPELFFVAEQQGQIVGTVIAGFDGVRGWVHKVAVHPDARRRSIAQSLMQRAENALRDLGCVKLNLQVRAGNHAAAAFYLASGYAVEERISFSKHLASDDQDDLNQPGDPS